MKKIYSIIAVVAMATVANAQVFNATFDDLTDAGGGGVSAWGGKSASNDHLNSYETGGTWGLEETFKGQGCVRVGTGSKQGSITTPEINFNGDLVLTFKAGAWDGKSEKTALLVSVDNGQLDQSEVEMKKASYTDYTLKITGVTGSVKVTFKGKDVKNSRFFIDDIKLVDAKTLSTINFGDAKNLMLVKNTQVNNELVFGAKSDIKIINMNGQVVKTASVSEGTQLNVSELGAGIYIVTGSVNGQAVSQKIIKK